MFVLVLKFQAYGRAADMSSENRGLQSLFRKEVLNPLYMHCNSHKQCIVIEFIYSFFCKHTLTAGFKDEKRNK